MSTVVANMSMSVDGFIEDRHGDANQHLFAWYASGQRSSTMPGDGRQFRTSDASADLRREVMAGLGALVGGRTLFDLTSGWGGRHPTGVPVFVVTHEQPAAWRYPDAPFTFVLDGVASAVEQASDVAADKTVAVASAEIARQCLELSLLDAIMIDLVPVLLGEGKPWFAGLGAEVRLEDPVITPGEGVTHLFYRVQR